MITPEQRLAKAARAVLEILPGVDPTSPSHYAIVMELRSATESMEESLLARETPTATPVARERGDE